MRRRVSLVPLAVVRYFETHLGGGRATTTKRARAKAAHAAICGGTAVELRRGCWTQRASDTCPWFCLKKKVFFRRGFGREPLGTVFQHGDAQGAGVGARDTAPCGG